MKANIIGATGAVGSELLALLLKEDAFEQVHVIGRRALNFDHPKLTQSVNTDINAAISMAPAAEVWFCTLGTTIAKAGSQEAFEKVDLEMVVASGEKAIKDGAAQFHVVSALGAKVDSTFFYNRVKGKMEHKLTALHLPALHIYRPSFIEAKRNEVRTGEQIALMVFKLFSWMMVGKMKRYKPIKASDIAHFMMKQSLTQSKGVFVWNSEKMHP